MIKLTITEKGGDARLYSFEKNEILIGRVQGNDIVLPKGNISKRHAKLTLADGRIAVADLKSTNGTYVNGRKISGDAPVRAGDKIFVGDFLITIDTSAGAPETTGGGSPRRAATPPPPPPPPPRPGNRPAASAAAPETTEAESDDEGFGALGEHAPTTGRGRSVPPAPPPPPPRRTIVMPPLEDDGVDIGLEDAPPSPADVSTDDAAADLSAGEAPESPLSSDVFGTRPAEDEDASLGGDLAPPAPPSPPTPPPAPPPVSGRAAASASADLREATASRTSGVGAVSAPVAPGGDRETPPPQDLVAAQSAETRAAPMPTAPATTLEALLADVAVTTIIVSAGQPAEIDRAGKRETTGSLGDANTVAETVWQLANTALPPPPPDNPVVDLRLPDGTRLTALFPPIASAPVVASIRKASVPQVPLGDVAGSGDVERILSAAIGSRRNILLAGDGQAIGALAGALAGAIPDGRHVVGIGAGIRSRPGWLELNPAGDTAALVRSSVAFRGDHLLIAGPSAGELPEVLMAAAHGQEGIIAGVAARSAVEALDRVRAFAAPAVGQAGLSALLGSTINLIVFGAVLADGTVRVLEIAEPTAEGPNVVAANVARRPEKERGRTAVGVLDVAGVSSRLAAAISSAGETLPTYLVRR